MVSRSPSYLYIILCVVLLCRSALAQASSDAVLKVKIVTSDGEPVGGADVILTSSDGEAFRVARSDSLGLCRLQFTVDGGSYSVVVRKIGFARVARSVNISAGDSVSLSLTTERVRSSDLPAVRVDTRARRYFVDSSEVARSTRTLPNALEVLRKLRPALLGDHVRCPKDPVDNVWVNGRRVLFMARNAAAVIPARRMPPKVRAVFGSGVSTEPPLVDSVLVTIRAEHLAEVRYVNCWDTSTAENGTNNAIFIVLKPGYGWDWKRGSFRDSTVAPR